MQRRQGVKDQLIQRGMSTTAISGSDKDLLHAQRTNKQLDLPQRWENPLDVTVVVYPQPVHHLNKPNSMIGWIIRLILITFVAAIVVLFIWAPIWVAPTILGLLFLFIAYRISKVCKLSTREFSRGETRVGALPIYQDPTLLKQAWDASPFKESLIFYQPREGYCAHATFNTFLHSIPIPSPPPSTSSSAATSDVTSSSTTVTNGAKCNSQNLRYCMSLPKLPRPYSLSSLFKFITTQIGDIAGGAVRQVELIPGTLSVQEFQAVIQDANRADIRILANFHRLPLFFADRSTCKRYMKAFAGHWSPVGAYIASTPTNNVGPYGALLLIDVNKSYGSYIVDVERLWEAVCTRDFGTEQFRGLLRITL